MNKFIGNYIYIDDCLFCEHNFFTQLFKKCQSEKSKHIELNHFLEIKKICTKVV